jgi:hypothetical protein
MRGGAKTYGGGGGRRGAARRDGVGEETRWEKGGAETDEREL